jgi:hypothetical protein
VLLTSLIGRFDFLASKTHSVIVPSCGFDSMPSDRSAYLSVRALKERLGSSAEAGRSVTAHASKGGISGGTLSTIYTMLAEFPLRKFTDSLKDHALSPAAGVPSPPLGIAYSLPHVSPPISGGFFVMSSVNRAIVLRTRGLLEVHSSMRPITYGPQFNYEEFSVTPNRFAGILLSLSIYAISLCLGGSRIVSSLMNQAPYSCANTYSGHSRLNGCSSASSWTKYTVHQTSEYLLYFQHYLGRQVHVLLVCTVLNTGLPPQLGRWRKGF